MKMKSMSPLTARYYGWYAKKYPHHFIEHKMMPSLSLGSSVDNERDLERIKNGIWHNPNINPIPQEKIKKAA